MFKNLLKWLGVKSETKETVKILSVTTENSEELTNRLKQFDNQVLLEKIENLELVITFLAQKIEIQTNIVCKQSDAIREINTSLEEMAFAYENLNATSIRKDEDESEDEESSKEKKYIN
ncbi:hypothetical protein EBU71_10630 [bacterium]|nr:hypothetical protein [Candidatus Elulimicrobium humile]